MACNSWASDAGCVQVDGCPDYCSGLTNTSLHSAGDGCAGQVVLTHGLAAYGDGGGGKWYWDATQDKANAEFGTIIDTSVAFNLSAQGTGSGTGCWVREYSGAMDIVWFGADPTGGTANDAPAINAALASIGVDGTVLFPEGEYNLTESVVIPLSTDIGRLFLSGYGAKLNLTGSIVGIDRERPPSESSAYTTHRIFIAGFTIEGDYSSWSYGIRLFTTYGAAVRDCEVRKCDIGFGMYFCMMLDLSGCFSSSNVSYGFFIGSGGSDIDGNTALPSGSFNNSNSNGAVVLRCRDYAATGTLASFKAEACEMVFRSCISEGNPMVNCYEYDNHNSTVSKGITIDEPHNECAPTNAIYKIHSTGGVFAGVFIIRAQDTVVTAGGWTGYLLDFGVFNANVFFMFEDTKGIYNVTKYFKGAHSNYSPTIYTDQDPTLMTATGAWDDSTVGVVVSSAPGRTNTNQFISAQSNLGQIGDYKSYAIDTVTTLDITAGTYLSLNDSYDITVNPGSTSYGMVLNGRLKAFGAVTGVSSLGTVVGKYPIYDEGGSFIGYAPLYDAITT